MKRQSDDAELTDERVAEGPLCLLNVSEEDLRSWLQVRMMIVAEDPHRWSFGGESVRVFGRSQAEQEKEIEEQTDLAVRLLNAFREAFIAITREALNAQELAETADALSETWREVRAPLSDDFWRVASLGGPMSWADEIQQELDDPSEDDPRLAFQRFPRPDEDHRFLAWYALQLERTNVWEKLADLLESTVTSEPQRVLVCPVCGRIQKKTRLDQVYCSQECQQRAAYLRRKSDQCG